jgi:hypothetical protein
LLGLPPARGAGRGKRSTTNPNVIRGQTRPHPGQEGALVRQVIAGLRAQYKMGGGWLRVSRRIGCCLRTSERLGLFHCSRLSSLRGLLRGERLLYHRINDSKRADQFLWEGVALAQVRDAVRTHPDLAIRTLPDEDFEGQIKCEQRGRNHEGRAPFWIAKDQYVGFLHREADASG